MADLQATRSHSLCQNGLISKCASTQEMEVGEKLIFGMTTLKFTVMRGNIVTLFEQIIVFSKKC
jgi:hypothetical protein